ncbi:MAG: 50S ribosomal protein L23 [Candidatus Pacebacteria bacterium]|nr:50S ribosomal protein L23 [Candidatus Paceibacterota bacterium]
MAIFTKHKKTKLTVATKTVEKNSVAHVLKHPWLSEKALLGTENGVYVFAVPPEVTKFQVKDAVQAFYGVTPKKVNVVNLPAKKVALKTRRGVGTRARRHKAYVFLKKGDTIAFA